MNYFLRRIIFALFYTILQLLFKNVNYTIFVAATVVVVVIGAAAIVRYRLLLLLFSVFFVASCKNPSLFELKLNFIAESISRVQI